MFPVFLTSTSLIITIEFVVGGASTGVGLITVWNHRVSQAQVRTSSIVPVTGIPACLSRVVKHQDVHHLVKIVLDCGPIFTRCFVGFFYTFELPVCPIQEVLILGQGHWTGYTGVGDNCSVTA